MSEFFNKLKSILKVVLPIIFLGILFSIYNDDNDNGKYQAHKNRIIYNNFKKFTLDILKNNYETSNYDFKLLNRVTFMMTHDNFRQTLLICILSAINRFHGVGIVNIMNKYIDLINTYPILWLVITLVMLQIIKSEIPVIDTFDLIISIIFCTYLIKFFDLFRNNI